ncbi:cysteine hydrolase family protein [Pseudalkalibacillus sp. SCS-8]|uniref:cysteine hydrolase family protein n=1 Tax=Pseudalkalibacillus nanhaiensis TaxID=3115291 RepID=UPI0032DA52BA
MKKALLIVDVQDAFNDPKWGERNNHDAEENIKRLLTEWRKKQQEVIFIQHQSQNHDSVFHPDHPGYRIKEIVKPLDDEMVIRKEVNSAFIGTSLEHFLHDQGIKEVVITGLTTQHCVSTTTRMSGNLGFHTFLISDATAAFELTDHNGKAVDPQTIHDVSLATIHNEFATVCSTEDYLEKYF